MTKPTGWALGLGVLVLALLVALLPRDETEQAAPDPDLNGLRAEADLAACPTPSPAASVVDQLDDVTATCLADGSEVSLGAALAGRTTLVNVWATWCPPCREELPVLQRYAVEPGAADVLTVQVASSPRAGLELLRDLGVRLPTVHDGDDFGGEVRTALQVPQALPASYVVSAAGEVRFIENPRLLTDVASVRAAVETYGGAA